MIPRGYFANDIVSSILISKGAVSWLLPLQRRSLGTTREPEIIRGGRSPTPFSPIRYLLYSRPLHHIQYVHRAEWAECRFLPAVVGPSIITQLSAAAGASLAAFAPEVHIYDQPLAVLASRVLAFGFVLCLLVRPLESRLARI